MSQDTDLTRGGHTYSMSCDTIEVTSMSPPMKVDPTWEEVDDHGHAHRADGDTYGYVVTESWVDADGDDRDNGAYRCTTCGDEVALRFVVDDSKGWAGGVRQFVRGMTHYYRDGVEITLDEWAAATHGAST